MQGAGCRVQGAGCRVQGAGCASEDAEARVEPRGLHDPQHRHDQDPLLSGFGFQVLNFGFLVFGFGFRVLGVGCRVPGVGCRVSGVGSRVSGFVFRVAGLRFLVSGFEFRIQGFLVGLTFVKFCMLCSSSINVRIVCNRAKNVYRAHFQPGIGYFSVPRNGQVNPDVRGRAFSLHPRGGVFLYAR